MIEPVNDIVKEYPDMFKITFFNKPRHYLKDPNDKFINNRYKENKIIRSVESAEDNLQRSVRRTRSVMFDYTKCNDFNLFLTFTFNPEKVDRYDVDGCALKMQSWLWRQQRKHEGNLKYIIVPEKHKDGAIHFHGMFEGYTGDLAKTKVIQNSKRVYNLPAFRFGFTNVQYLDDDKQKAAAYICKYITKDMELIHGKRRYWASKNLSKPVKFYNKIHDWRIPTDLKDQVFINDALAIYEVQKAKVAQQFDL